MLRIETILVPTDFSEGAEVALQIARALGRDHQAKIVLVEAYTPPPIVSEALVPIDDYDGVKESMKRRLQELANSITTLPVEARAIIGAPGPAIVEAAGQCKADLIVMGTHGRSGMSRLLMGSVAEHVLRHAPCPVLTIKPSTAEHLQQEMETALSVPEPVSGPATVSV